MMGSCQHVLIDATVVSFLHTVRLNLTAKHLHLFFQAETFTVAARLKALAPLVNRFPF